MEQFLLLVFFGIVFGGLIFVVSTLMRLSNQGERIDILMKDVTQLRNELRNERLKREKVVLEKETEKVEADVEVDSDRDRSEVKERFDEAKERTERSAARASVESEKPAEPVVTEEAEEIEEAAEEENPKPMWKVTKLDDVKTEGEIADKGLIPEPSPAPKSFETKKPEEPGKWQRFLERIYLWPPSGDTAAEATIVGWWTIRLGLIVFIIGATFAGIHVAKDVPAWVRVAAMSGVAAGVVFLGTWLEKRLAGFGRMIVAGGLGLGYFTAFAAFALEPMQIITSPEVALLVQAVMVAVIVGWSLWRDDELIAGMGTVLGYVSCWFSYRHDAMNFVVVGLLLLGGAAAFLLWKRRWLWPQASAVIGTWGGFLLLGMFEWSKGNGAPGFSILLGCFGGAALIFEAAHFFAGPSLDINSEKAKWLRRLSVIASSASIFVGFFVFGEVYPDLKSGFFLMMSVLMLGLAAAHFFRKAEISKGLDQMFFLKSSALLCLFIVSEFDGPVRWISLVAQTGALLWTWRQTRYRWVELGFAALFLVSIGTIIGNAAMDEFAVVEGSFFNVPKVVGLISLTGLSCWLALYRLWKFPNPLTSDQAIAYNPLAAIGAVLIAAAGLPLSGISSDLSDIQRPVFLIITALAVTAPLFLFRRFIPAISGTILLLMACPALLFRCDGWHLGQASVLLFGVVGICVLVLELCRLYWPKDWSQGYLFRGLYGLIGLLVTTRAFALLLKNFESGFLENIMVLALGGIGFGLLWHFSKPCPKGKATKESDTHDGIQWLISVATGITLALFGAAQLPGDFGSVTLATAAAIVASVAFLVRSPVPMAAAGFPLMMAVLMYLRRCDLGFDLGRHALIATLLLAVVGAILVVSWRATRGKQGNAFQAMELVLHLGVVAIIHWFVRNALPVSGVVAFDALLALGILVIARMQPMRALKGASGIPLVYATLHVLSEFFRFHDNAMGDRMWWWVGAVSAAIWGWLYFQGAKIKGPRFSVGDEEKSSALTEFNWVTGLVAVTFSMAAGLGVFDPWKPLAFAAFGLILITMWRGFGLRSGNVFSYLFLAIAAILTFAELRNPNELQLSTIFGVTILTALVFLTHGVINSRKDREFQQVAFIPASLALIAVFQASYPGVLVVENLTTACWGVASIVVFIFGLFAGFKHYRVVGLIGLGIALARVFVVDLDDTLYRIFASISVALILIGISFLYHRFRDRIDSVGK